MHLPSPHLPILLLVAMSAPMACTSSIGGPIADEDGLFDPDSADDIDPGTPDDPPPDAPPVDEVAERCGVPASVGDLGARTGSAVKDEINGNDLYELLLVVNSGPPDDVMWIGLFEDYGAFKNGIQTGTFNIAGDDTSPTECGACIALDINATATSAERSLMAQSGQLTISSLNGSVQGSIQNLVMREYDIQAGTLIPGGCETTVASMQFSAALP